MKHKLLAALGGASVFLLAGTVLALAWNNAALRRAHAEQAQRMGAYALANANQEAALAALRHDAAQTAAKLLRMEREKAALRSRARHVEKRTQEALAHVTAPNVHAPWPAAVHGALCLRWLAAEGRLPHAYTAHNAAPPHNAQTDSIASFCAAWNTLTPADTVTWAGALLDHAGELALERAAARE